MCLLKREGERDGRNRWPCLLSIRTTMSDDDDEEERGGEGKGNR